MNQTNRMLKQILDIYKDCSLWTKIHIFIRFKGCPFLELMKYVPREGKILDLGCGHGVFIHLLWLAGFRNGTLIGADLSESVIDIAKRTVDGKDMKFYARDISAIDEDQVNCITILDVFHLLPPDVQDEVLDKCYRKLPTGGLLLLKDVHERPYWKYCFDVLQETISVKLLRITEMKEYKFYFMRQDAFMQTLSRKGFEVRPISMDAGYLYPHILYLCRKKG
jgi:ubiquinone/menaquinone biosynthesis C-methylase UbiE